MDALHGSYGDVCVTDFHYPMACQVNRVERQCRVLHRKQYLWGTAGNLPYISHDLIIAS